MRWALYGHVQPGFPAVIVATRRSGAEVPWLTPGDAEQIYKSMGRRLYLRLRDNRAGEVYPDEAWADEIA